MARSILSFGMFSFFAARIAVRKRGLELGSPPPMRAAMEISRMILVKARPRFASVAAFLCLIVAHFECPDMTHPLLFRVPRRGRSHRWIDFSPQNGFGERRPLSGRILRRPSGYRTSSLPMYGRQEKRHQCGDYDAVLCFIGYVRATFWIACLASKSSKAAFLFGADATSLTPRDGRNWKIPIKKVFWPRLFRLADQVIVPSSDGRDFMCSLGIQRDQISLMGDCVDNDWWIQQSKQVDRAAVRASW